MTVTLRGKGLKFSGHRGQMNRFTQGYRGLSRMKAFILIFFPLMNVINTMHRFTFSIIITCL